MDSLKLEIDVAAKSDDLKLLIDRWNSGNITIKQTTQLKKLLNAEGREAINILDLESEEAKRYAAALRSIEKAQSDLRLATDQGREAYFRTGTELRQRTLPMMTSFSQIIQDAPFGIRGIGNNLEMLTQQLVQLSAQGVAATTMLKGFWMNLMGPAGILFAVSTITSILTVIEMMPDATDKQDKQQKKLNEEIERTKKLQSEILAMQYDLGDITGKKYLSILGEQLKAMEKQRDAMLTIWFLQKEQFDPSKFGPPQLRTPGFTSTKSDASNVAGDFDVQRAKAKKNALMDLEKEILELRKRIEGITDDEKKKREKDQKDADKERADESRAGAGPLFVVPNLAMKGDGMIKKLIDFENKQREIAVETAFADAKALDMKRSYLKLQWETGELDDAQYVTELKKLQTIYREKDARVDVLEIQKEIDAATKKSLKDMDAFEKSGLAAIQAMTNAINQGFASAWEKTFGEANSLLEIFAQQFITTLESIAVKYAIFSLLSAAFPGAGIVGMVGKSFGFLAEGGIVTEPIVGRGRSGKGYVIGEAGPEAVIPLSQLSNILAANRIGTSSPIQLSLQIDSRDLATVTIDEMNRMTYRRVIS